MPTETFYPYATAADRIPLAVNAVGADIEAGSDGSILAYKHPAIDPLLLRIVTTLPDDVINRTIPLLERDNPPVELMVSYVSAESRARGRVPLRPASHGAFEGELSLTRKDWRGSLWFDAVLVRRSWNSTASPGYGNGRGTLLAWSDSVRVVFDEPQLPPGSTLELWWESFEESNDPLRRRHPEHLFALDLSRERPAIVLNKGFSGAVDVLMNENTQGRRARIRDATFYMIAHQVWTSLLGTAFAALQQVSSETPDLDPREWLEGLEDWQKRAVRDWSGYIFDEEDDIETALDRLLHEARTSDGVSNLMTRLPSAIQHRLRTYRGFASLVAGIQSL
jgi:hypothetical protein